MDDHPQQQQQELPLYQTTESKMPQEAMVARSTATATPLVTKSEQQLPTNPLLAVELGAVEEFLIGCLSGITGAALSWVRFSGFPWLFYVLLLPTLLLEIWESWAIFSSATHYNNNQHQAYQTALHLAVARKRLARQLYGQGVIMGQAALDITSVDGTEQNLLVMVTLYATLWLCWIIACHVMDSNPPEDKILKVSQAKKQRRHKSRRSSSSVSSSRRRRSSLSSHSSYSSIQSSRRSSRINRTSLRHSKSTDMMIPLSIP